MFRNRTQEKLFFQHQNNSHMSYIFIFIVFISNVVISQSASRKLSLQTGASVTIPCPYDRKYIHHKKYWCYDAASAYNYCTVQAYVNETQGKVTVTDNPAESLFTVTMKDLQTGNTGAYWCVVEIAGITHDVTEQLSIKVKADPDLSVRESRVSGDEGGSVTVQCLYSAAYQQTQKRWCRFRDRSCNYVTRPDTSQNSTVNISDDGKSLFSVQMCGLKKSDGGWYWCSAGELEVPVHISVRDPPPATVITTTHHVTMYIEKVETLIHWYLAAFLLLLVILVIISCLLRKKCKAENQIKTREGSSDTTIHTSSALKDNEDVTYSSVKMTSQDKTVTPNAVKVEIIYSSVVCQ